MVLYTSKYGSTKQYAEWIAGALSAELAEANTVKPELLGKYDVVVYGGGLYAGGIAGVKLVTQSPVKNLVVFTVGLADPKSTDYSEIIAKSITGELRAKTKIFHLRGDIDYKRLNAVHKVMMAMMKKMILKTPESQRTADDKIFLETYGRQIDFAQKETIQPLVEYVQAIHS